MDDSDLGKLFEIFHKHLARTRMDFFRYLFPHLEWNERLVGLTGARGTGKTTMILQYIKKHFLPHENKALYVSLDNLLFASNTLYALADSFQKQGGTHLFLDEVHKYEGWSREIKNIYDDFPTLHVFFTGSSMMEIHKSGADLSRRALVRHLHGMSFREYLELEYGEKFEPVSWEELCQKHGRLAGDIIQKGESSGKIKILPAFKSYLQHGYFPYYKENQNLYAEKLLATLDTVLEVDLPSAVSIDYHSIRKMRKLFSIISTLVPFTPNISKLAADVGSTRGSLHNYLDYLNKAEAIMFLQKEANGMSQLVKPEKIYLGNTNYAYALGTTATPIGNVRETFFLSHVRVKEKVTFSDKVDFLVNGESHFEIGGPSKTNKQLQNMKNGYLAIDGIETGFGNRIPLWLFGFLY